MSSIRYNLQSMNGILSVSDGNGGILENGVLTCDSVITQDIQASNLNVKNNITGGESMAIGRDIAIGNSVVVPNLYTTKIFVSSILETTNIKTDIIKLSNNLQIYDDSTVGYIKNSSIIVSKPLLFKNDNVSITSISLPIGVYVFNYNFDIELSDISTPALHSISHGLSSDNVSMDILKKRQYDTIVFNDIDSYLTINETGFYHVTNYNASVYLLAVNNSVASGFSNIVLKNVKLSALRIA